MKFILGSLETHSGVPISVNWTFFASCYGRGATGEYWLKFSILAPTKSSWPKISGTRGHSPPTTILVRRLGWMIFHVV